MVDGSRQGGANSEAALEVVHPTTASSCFSSEVR